MPRTCRRRWCGFVELVVVVVGPAERTELRGIDDDDVCCSAGGQKPSMRLRTGERVQGARWREAASRGIRAHVNG